MIASMKILLLAVFLSFWNSFNCFENLSKRNTTILEQSSTYIGHGVTLANDGNLVLKEWFCAHTDFYQPRAWLQVDLEKPFSISNVKIYHRSEDSWKQYRFRQFYLDVSGFTASTSTTSQRTRCYTDNTTYPDLPPSVIDIPCQHTARYVIVETKYNAPENVAVAGAILEICEIEIYGCEIGKYGDDCKPCVNCQVCDIKSGHCGCSDTCQNQRCDSASGQCLFGCETGFWGDYCSSECTDNCLDRNCSKINGTCDDCIRGSYGDKCDKMCSPGCASMSCDRQSGICSDGCRPNWTGYRCDTCDSSHYGSSCSGICSINCTGGCKQDNGECYSCVEGTFGAICNKTCGPGCASGCDQITGHCTCKQGWQKDTCVECSPNHFGEFCDKQCSPNCNRGTCFDNNGTCDSGCKCHVVHEMNVQVERLKNSSNQHFLYAITSTVLFLLSLVVNLLLSIRYSKGSICRCKRQQSRKNENRSPSATNVDIQSQVIDDYAQMETDYENLSVMRFSQHLYDKVG